MIKKNSKFIALFSSVLILLLTTTTVLAATTIKAPENSSFKTYMDYRTIESKITTQWTLREQSYTNEYGLRMYRGRYMVAVGSGFKALPGDYIDVTLSTGNVLKCIVGDAKADCDTDNETHKYIPFNGNVVEFIVDTDVLDRKYSSDGSLNDIPGLEGDVVNIKVYTESEAVDIQYEELCYATSNLVINKFTKSIAGNTYYFIEYVSDSEVKTVSVSKDAYDNYECYLSFYK